MRKIEKIQIVKNVTSSWFALGVNIVVGIFLSPFILHRLGDSAFGIWVLIFSITGYYGLFDLGIRSSIVRYISKFTATGDTEAAAKLLNTSLFSYCGVGILSFIVTILVAANAHWIFKVPLEYRSTAPWLLLMAGTAVALGFPLGVFGGVLEGLQKFYVLNWTNIASTLLRAILIVYFLRRGYGLLTAIFITVAVPMVASVVRGVIALRILPLPLRWRYVDRSTLREMAHYSSATLITIVASRLRFNSDEIVIGTMLSAAAVTYFNIGARIVDYAGEVVTSLAQVFVPMSSQSDAKGDMVRLRKILVAGNRFCAFIIFPICAILIILGKSVIEVWVGQKYIVTSYPVLVVMIIPSTLFFAQAASGRILFGMGKHRTVALVNLAEGIVNLVLSIILVRPFGIIGDALGTAIPLTCTMIFFLPAHLCHILSIRILTFLREAYVLPLIMCAPLTLTLLLLKKWFVAHNYRELGMQLGIAGFVYGIGLLWAYLNNHVLRVGDLSPPKEPVAPAFDT